MGHETLGTQKGDSKKTPTLRQYIKNGGGKVSITSLVKIVFKPTDYSGYSLVSDHDYRVEVLSTNPLADYLRDHLQIHSDQGDSLRIRVVNPAKCEWELEVTDDYTCEWTEYKWGWKLDHTLTRHEKTNPTRRVRSATSSDHSSKTSSDSPEG